MSSVSLSLSMRSNLMVSSAKYSPSALFSSGEVGVWFDPTDITTLYQDVAGTTPITAPGQTCALMRDKSGNAKHATQSTAAQRPTYGVIPYGGVRNILTATDTLSTQTVSVGAITQTLSFTGTGTVVLSGAFIGSLVGTGASNQVSLTFTPTSGSLTLTVTGSVTFAQLEKGSSVTAYQKVTTKYNVTEAGKASLGVLYPDGIDDGMVTPSINFSGTNKMTVWAGLQKMSDATTTVLVELGDGSVVSTANFTLSAPGAAGSAGYRFTSRGSIAGNANIGSGYASPNAAVLTGVGDISGDIDNLLVNNVVVATGVTDQGTGNYGNYPLYLFRRGGTSLPFNGIFTGLIVRGAASSASQISNTNTFLNSKLGAY